MFSNLKKVVRFVSFEHLVRDIDFWSEQCGVYLSHSSVTVQVHLPRSRAVLAKLRDRAFQELGPLAGSSQ